MFKATCPVCGTVRFDDCRACVDDETRSHGKDAVPDIVKSTWVKLK